MSGTAGRAGDQRTQLGLEQAAVDAMYARLDAERSARRAERDRLLAEAVDGPSEAHARDAQHERLRSRLHQLDAAEASLCFGRLDPCDGGRSLPVGRIGLRAENGEILLVDWRADAARPFYAATPGRPLGIRRRRHLRVQDRRVTGLSDEILDGSSPNADDVVGDGPLVAALRGARTGRMREAASTLQAEQDEIVRSPHRGVMVVDGGPGTGKTIVALHRAAYVLYAWPRVAERGVLVYGPNQRFLSYISDVLPSLGEDDVRRATLSDLVGRDADRAETARIARWKGRGEMAVALEEAVRSREPQGLPLVLGVGEDEVELPAATLDAARRRALHGDIGHNAARQVFLESVVEDVVNLLEERASRQEAAFEEELRTQLGIDVDRLVAGDLRRLGPQETSASGGTPGIAWDRVRDELLEDPGIDRAVDRVWPRLRAEDLVRAVLSDASALRRALPDADAEGLSAIVRDAGSGWSSADLALLDEARALVDGPPRDLYGHVVVDEAQQLSSMQWRAVMRRCPDRSMTVVGDLAQVGPDTEPRSWDEALDPFTGGRHLHRTLSVNYRTTAEILETTRPLLARIAPEQRLSRSLRHGERARTVSAVAGGAESVVRDLCAELRRSHPGELIGVITADATAPALRARIEDADVSVLGASETRGLEFDAVVIVDPAAIEDGSDAGLRDLYVARTRATQRLVILEVSAPVPVSPPR